MEEKSSLPHGTNISLAYLILRNRSSAAAHTPWPFSGEYPPHPPSPTAPPGGRAGATAAAPRHRRRGRVPSRAAHPWGADEWPERHAPSQVSNTALPEAVPSQMTYHGRLGPAFQLPGVPLAVHCQYEGWPPPGLTLKTTSPLRWEPDVGGPEAAPICVVPPTKSPCGA